MSERQTGLTKRLIADGLKRTRVPFDFNRRVSVARTYLDDGALRTAADRLEALARDMRAAADAEDATLSRRRA